MHLDWQAYSEVVALRTAISEVLMTDLLWSQDATCPLTYFHLLNCYTHFHLSFGYLILLLLLLRLAFDFCRRHVWWRLPFDSDLISDLINGWKLCDRRCRHPFIVRLESLAFGQFWQLNTFDASVMIWIDSLIFFGMTVGRFDDSCGRFVAACTTWWVASALHYILQDSRYLQSEASLSDSSLLCITARALHLGIPGIPWLVTAMYQCLQVLEGDKVN